ncbi:MAG TPA: cation:proton antiporter [Candidatus Limnocylindrales bacterium]|nr:cation:proton antiporter [Candidatus Limnocylindrales bacterium]
MEHTAGPILEIGVLLLGAVIAGWAARRIGLPAVVGYLAIGILVSPFTPGYVADHDQLQLLADLGVVLLLFEVGIEVDILRIHSEQRGLLLAAPVQTLLTTAVSAAALLAAGLEPIAAALVGLSIAMSSSVVIVNITKSRRRTTDRPTEQALLGWSALQDSTGVALAAVLLALLGTGGRPLDQAAVGIVAFVVLAVVVARLLPMVLRALRAEHDLFLIVSVASGLTLAGIGSATFGVPLALAAFVGGLAVTESPEAAEARRRLLPFRDVFAVLFFVAIGTLIEPGALRDGLGWLAVFLVLIVLAKVVVAYGLARLARLPVRPLQLAVGLGQIGEFSFVLGSAAAAAGAITHERYVALVAAVAISIAVSTVVVRMVGAPVARPEAAAGTA